jgi:hypothetical protein
VPQHGEGGAEVPRFTDLLVAAGDAATGIAAKRYRFEVVDMDGNRVDRVLVSRVSPPSGSGSVDSPRQHD